MDSVIPSLLAGLAGPEPGQALAGLRVILGVRPAALAAMLPKLLKPPLSLSDITALGSLAEVAGLRTPRPRKRLPPPTQFHTLLCDGPIPSPCNPCRPVNCQHHLLQHRGLQTPDQDQAFHALPHSFYQLHIRPCKCLCALTLEAAD